MNHEYAGSCDIYNVNKYSDKESMRRHHDRYSMEVRRRGNGSPRQCITQFIPHHETEIISANVEALLQVYCKG